MSLGRLWHPEHFICVQCKEPLGTQNFFERDTLPYCERDYYLLFSPRCALCNGPIFDVSKLHDYNLQGGPKKPDCLFKVCNSHIG